jgi:ubiquinone/menaquinone biosynthesis C-methylase UbiE
MRSSKKILLAGIMLASLIVHPNVFADSAKSFYQQGAKSADGIGKFYMGREIAQIMGWQGAEWLERENRNEEERTDALINELHLKPGMIVADIGAGSGYISRRMAPLVTDKGIVYAVDVEPEMVRKLSYLTGRYKMIKPIKCNVDDVCLPPNALDLAIMVDVYHELEYPHEMLASIARALKPGGKVVFVEYRAEDPSVPIKELHKMSEAQVKREVEGLSSPPSLLFDYTAEPLSWQHIIVFRKP